MVRFFGVFAFLIGLAHSAAATVPTFMWVWEEDNIVMSAKRTTLISDATAKGITTLYIAAQNSVVNQHNILSTAIGDFHTAGLKVELLFGDACWINPGPYSPGDPCANDGGTQSTATGLIDQIANLTNKPDGVHFDVEISQYLMLYPSIDWTTGGSGADALGANYQTLMQALASHATTQGVTVAEEMQESYYTVEVTISGHQHPLRNFVMQAIDGGPTGSYTVILSYHTTPAAIEAGAVNFVNYAQTNSYPIVIGVEIDPDSCTECSYGNSGKGGITQMDTDLAAVASHFSADTELQGFAVESYDNY